VPINEMGGPARLPPSMKATSLREMALFTVNPHGQCQRLEETEMLEIGHAAMKNCIRYEPDLWNLLAT